MKKSMVRIVNDFGKQKLIMYANGFRNLARTYKNVDRDMDLKEEKN